MHSNFLPIPFRSQLITHERGLVIEFGRYRLDTAQRLLYCDGERLHLTPKLIDTLTVLVESQDRIVSRAELSAALWPNMVVEASGIARNISMLRRALGCNGEQYIETVSKRGYRFVADARVATGAPVAAAQYGASRFTGNTNTLPIVSAISPDGRYLAYGQMDALYLRLMGSTDIHQLSSPACSWASFIYWFSSNQRVLVHGLDQRTGRTLLWSVPILGGEPAMIDQDVTVATTSPIDDWIAFVCDGGVWIAHEDGGSQRQLAVATEHEYFLHRLQFSEDGRFLLLGRTYFDGRRNTVDSLRISDGAARTLFETQEYMVDFRLLPNNQLLVLSIQHPFQTRMHLSCLAVDFGERQS